MSEQKPTDAIQHSHAPITHSYGAEGDLLESLSYALVSDACASEEIRQAPGITATPDSIQIVKQLIEYIKAL